MIAARLFAQGLTAPTARHPEEVVRRVLAVQAQDLRGARLAIRSRSTGLSARDVDLALTERRSLIVTWLGRGTLHLVLAEDYHWLQALTTPQLAAGNARRLRQEGVSETQAVHGVQVTLDAVRTDGPQTRDQLRERLDAEGIPTARQALIHILLAASIAGHIIRGPVVGHEQAFVDVGEWLGPLPEVGREAALRRLGERYLMGHAPASPPDLAKWAGITLTSARLAIEPNQPLESTLRQMPHPRLLGAFDPILHGWASRELLVGDHHGVVTSNGVCRPTALVEGRVVATWGLSGGVVTLRPLEAISEGDMDGLHIEAADVLRFLGLAQHPLVTTDA